MTALTAADLLPFTLRERDRSWLSQPFVLGNFTYACNGHFAARIPGRHVETECDEKAKPLGIMFEEAAERTFQPFELVNAPSVVLARCETCEGARWVLDCDVCEATGEHECSDPRCGCVHECGCCYGKGCFPCGSKEKGKRYCDTCGGTGREVDHRNVLLGDGLSLRWLYLLRVQALPGPIEWNVPVPQPDKYDPKRLDYGAVAFRGSGWLAIILPVRTYGTEQITAIRHGCGIMAQRPQEFRSFTSQV